MKTFVLYHSNCYDGFGAAYAAWKKLGDSAEYIPVSYGKPIPEMPDGSEVFIVDFSYKREQLIELSKRCNVTVLDHHKTAQADLEGLENTPTLKTVFDMTRSGALITWEYFHRDYSNRPPNDSIPHEAPDLIKHISDRDLWKFAIPGSKAVHVYLQMLPFDFRIWDAIDINKAILTGGSLIEFRDSQVEMMCKNARIAIIDLKDNKYVECILVNATAFWSEVGNTLLDKNPTVPMAVTFCHDGDGRIVYSLRTRGDFDCSEIATQFGGGGHKPASGFKVDRIVHRLVECS